MGDEPGAGSVGGSKVLREGPGPGRITSNHRTDPFIEGQSCGWAGLYYKNAPLDTPLRGIPFSLLNILSFEFDLFKNSIFLLARPIVIFRTSSVGSAE